MLATLCYLWPLIWLLLFTFGILLDCILRYDCFLKSAEMVYKHQKRFFTKHDFVRYSVRSQDGVIDRIKENGA